MNLLFLDTETGGISTEHSVLTLTFTECTFEADKILRKSRLSVSVKPNNSIYRVNPEALNINGINLIEHSKSAVFYKEAESLIVDYIKQRFEANNRNKLVLVGQNIQFDLDHLITPSIINPDSFYRYVDRRVIDIVSISQFAKLCGLIPMDQSLSLSTLAQHLNIPINELKLHTAEYDNDLAATVLFTLRNLFEK